MNMKVERKAAIKKLHTLVFTAKTELSAYREGIENTFGTVFLPNNVECSECEYGGIKCDMLVPEVYTSSRIILYIHGGSFVGGSRNSWRNFCASVANAASCRVLVPEFRLAPTYPFPASTDDIVSTFSAVCENEELAWREANNFTDSKEAFHAQIILMADGSGASLAMALVFRLNKEFRNTIRDIIFFSPWLDLTSNNPLISGKKVSDEVISGSDLHRAVDMYTYATNISNPLVSPLQAKIEDFENFPPVYIQMGEKEILVQQAKQLADILAKVNVECVLDIWPDMIYMFQMADEYLPDSHLAVEKIGKYICRREEVVEDNTLERERIMKKNNIHIE